jgi:hypothetical protein
MTNVEGQLAAPPSPKRLWRRQARSLDAIAQQGNVQKAFALFFDILSSLFDILRFSCFPAMESSNFHPPCPAKKLGDMISFL